jgi:TatD DNase family protein
VACTLGVHPHEATLWSKQVRQFIFDNRQAKGLVAVGEIGLDYYYNNSPQDVQIAAFREQLELAEELGLPVQIHTRDADADTAKILREFRGRVRGLLHCFTSSAELAREALDCGFDLSFSGVVTFKNAQALRDVVRSVETDAPFLAPVPMRGKGNVPEFVLHTAQAVAEIKSVSLAELSRQTVANASRLFSRLDG